MRRERPFKWRCPQPLLLSSTPLTAASQPLLLSTTSSPVHKPTTLQCGRTSASTLSVVAMLPTSQQPSVTTARPPSLRHPSSSTFVLLSTLPPPPPACPVSGVQLHNHHHRSPTRHGHPSFSFPILHNPHRVHLRGREAAHSPRWRRDGGCSGGCGASVRDSGPRSVRLHRLPRASTSSLTAPTFAFPALLTRPAPSSSSSAVVPHLLPLHPLVHPLLHLIPIRQPVRPHHSRPSRSSTQPAAVSNLAPTVTSRCASPAHLTRCDVRCLS